MQTVSDVPIGVFLSGGIDSSTITAIAQGQSSQKIPSFTMGFHEVEMDERPYARLASEAFGTIPVET